MASIPAFSRLCRALCFGTMALSAAAFAAGDKAAYDQAKSAAKATYGIDSKACDRVAGNAKDVCVAQAKAHRVKAEATAEAAYKDTDRARRKAADRIADADYKVAKEKCDDQRGNAKDVCVKEAKAARVKVRADAKATQQTRDARNEAVDDKRDADYKVAVEKCDALSGDAKDACVAKAKADYRK